MQLCSSVGSTDGRVPEGFIRVSDTLAEEMRTAGPSLHAASGSPGYLPRTSPPAGYPCSMAAGFQNGAFQ